MFITFAAYVLYKNVIIPIIKNCLFLTMSCSSGNLWFQTFNVTCDSCPLKMLPCVLSWKRNPADSNITMIWSINDSKMWRLAIRIGLGTNSPSLPAVSFNTELLISPVLLRFSGLFKTIIRNVISCDRNGEEYKSVWGYI